LDRLGIPSGGSARHRRDGERPELDERADCPEPGHLTREARPKQTEGRLALELRVDATNGSDENKGRPRSDREVSWGYAEAEPSTYEFLPVRAFVCGP
jgi:hypothetical protein